MRNCRPPSRVQMPATRPKSVPFASATASSSSSNGIAASTGPNTSSCASRCVGRHVAQQRRRLVEAAARAPRRHTALRHHRDAASLRVGQEVPHALLLRCADQRAARRGPSPRARRAGARSLAQPIEQRLVDRAAAPAGATPAEQVWPAFCTIALITTGSAASRSASAKMICGHLPPSSSVTGQWRFGGGLLDQRARRRACR